MSGALSKPGTLYIVATPIGNLGDITDRAKQILTQVDLVAAEDTRHSGQLLHALGLSKSLFSLHEHNEASQAVVIIEKIKRGSNVALISDAGTPLISDPGFRLVDLAHRNLINVVPIPGASAVMTAISAAGISTASHRFVGFLPAKSKQRQTTLKELAKDTSTLVLFESPHRIRACLSDLVLIFGPLRMATFCRELTKKFETIYRASLGDINDFINADENQRRGEIVLVVAGNTDACEQNDSVDYQNLLHGMLEHMSLKDASALLAKTSTHSRNHFYDMGLKLKSD